MTDLQRENDILKETIAKINKQNEKQKKENKKLKTKIEKLNKSVKKHTEEFGFISNLNDDDKYILNNMKFRTMRTQLSKVMGGSVTRPKMFKLNKPEIELREIYSFLEKLNETRNQLNSCVYVNVCEDGRFYVGYCCGTSENIDNLAEDRLSQHRDNGGYTNFTYLHRVISCAVVFYGDKKDEDLVTMLMSKCVGDRVRGGQWASPFIKLPDFSKNSVDDIKQQLFSRHAK